MSGVRISGVFAEFEAAMISERVRAGVARAKRRGTKSRRPFGRPTLDHRVTMFKRDRGRAIWIALQYCNSVF